MNILRVIIGLASLVFMVLSGVFMRWMNGLGSFGGNDRNSAVTQIQIYFPLVVFVLIFLSILVMRRWFFHFMALLAVPCLLLSVCLTFLNAYIGLPLFCYFGLWFTLYYCFAWVSRKKANEVTY
jgi:hypothetical protein